MKKAIYLIIALIGLSAPSCSDSMLDFSPTDSGSGKELLKSASTAITSVNGVYRSMWTAGWSTTANTHQCFGIAAYNLALDCMADDLIMQSQGNGWFWGDHCYNVKSNYTSSAFRSYDVWYANYKWIANVNYIIDAEPEMAGTEADVAYVAGQAYAIRALCYLNLATWFSRAPYNSLTGASRWNEPCVPVYTTGTSIDTGGQPRESLRTVYGRIDQDIDRAIELLEKARETTLAENNKSHINLYVALGIKSRACLAEGDWDGAFKAAKRVIDEGGYAVGTKSDLTSGMNSLDKQNVMWGAGIQVADQAGGYAGFFTHMDNKEGAYAKSAPKLISKQLYNRISATDIRRDWWDPSDKESPYVSKKFSFANVASFLGDYIYMRVEEMYFIEAEAKAHENLGEGIRLLNEFMNNYRIVGGGYDCTNMSSSVENFTNELMLQKRIEFWGEGIVMFDMKRLDMSTRRGYVGTNSPASYRLNTEGRAPYWNFVITRGETQNNPVIATQNNPDPSQTVKPWNG